MLSEKFVKSIKCKILYIRIGNKNFMDVLITYSSAKRALKCCLIKLEFYEIPGNYFCTIQPLTGEKSMWYLSFWLEVRKFSKVHLSFVPREVGEVYLLRSWLTWLSEEFPLEDVSCKCQFLCLHQARECRSASNSLK